MPQKKLLDRARDAIRRKHYSIRTEETYVDWIRRDILFHGKHHPQKMGSSEIEVFLTHLAVDRNVAASTQNQALSALLSLYREVLKKDVGPLDAVRAKKPKRLPTVLTEDEALQVIGFLSGTNKLMTKLLYGSGLRVTECARLRVKDVDFTRQQILVRDAKGEKGRVTMLPPAADSPLQEHLLHARHLYERDVLNSFGGRPLSPSRGQPAAAG